MLFEILKEIRNFFPYEFEKGNFKVEDGRLDLSLFLRTGQYFLIEGSVFNDGVYQYPAENLQDEEFTGIITSLAIPKAFLNLAAEIEDWQKAQSESSAAKSPYTSESFGGYSYTKATTSTGASLDWRTEFKSRLDEWRKV
jgi:hypothetical protein